MSYRDHRSWRTGGAVRLAGAALAATGASLLLAAAPQTAHASAAPAGAAAGSPEAPVKPHPRGGPPGPPGQDAGGVVQIHGSGTAATDRRNDPRVCSFSLAGFGFTVGQLISWRIESSAPGGDRSVVAQNTLAIGTGGLGGTSLMRLRDGQYRLSWTISGQSGKKGRPESQKTFTVDCSGAAAVPPGRDGAAGDDRPGDQREHPNGGGDAVSRQDWDTSLPGESNGSGAAPGPQPGNPGAAAGPKDDGAVPFTGRNVAAVTGTGFGLVLAAGLAFALIRHRRGGLTAAATAAGPATSPAPENTGEPGEPGNPAAVMDSSVPAADVFAPRPDTGDSVTFIPPPGTPPAPQSG